MRAMVELEPDTASAIKQLQRERGMSVSEAVNELIRRGMPGPQQPGPFRQQTHALGINIDLAAVADALEMLEAGAPDVEGSRRWS